jgi:MerR family copper efflux transcriptional regulator
MFIETAKRLRLSLTAIANLLAVWESDACRTVKHQLRPLLDDCLADAALGELQQLREHLAAARAQVSPSPN